jgi:hypothetical protein
MERLPVEHGGLEGCWLKRVRDLVAVARIGPGIFAATSLADGLGKIAVKVAEEGKWRLRAPFLAHEQHRRHRREQGDRERSFDPLRTRIGFEPVAERAVADLIVVLQEIDKGRWREMAARLAAGLVAPECGNFALIDKARGKRARQIRQG